QSVIGLDPFPMSGEGVASRSAAVGNSAWPAPETSQRPAPASGRTRAAALSARPGRVAAAPPSATGSDDSHIRREFAPAGVPKPPEEAGVSARPSTALAPAGSAA